MYIRSRAVKLGLNLASLLLKVAYDGFARNFFPRFDSSTVLGSTGRFLSAPIDVFHRVCFFDV